MRAQDVRLDPLRRQNPFTSASVGDPWERQYPHVPDINAQAFEGLCRLMAQRLQDPALNCAGLILGEVGSGKTHLLGRLLSYSQQLEPPCTFAYIQPLEDAEQPFRYLLREIVVNLCHPLAEGLYATQLDRLLAAVYSDVIETYGTSEGRQKLRTIQQAGRSLFRHMHPGLIEPVQKRARERLSLAFPGLSTPFLSVLFQYRRPTLRPAAVRWLTGNVLDRADAEVLEAPDRTHASMAQLELEARDLLTSLGWLLARYHQPLIVCFDRLENLETADHLHAFGKMLEFLVDTARGMLAIVCARGMQWEERFRRTLNQHVTSRLETNTFILQGCTAGQALALIRSRLASVLEPEAAAALFPFDVEALHQMFARGLHSPRLVIARANDQLRRLLEVGTVVQETPVQTLQAALDRQYQSVLRDFERYPPDRGRLRRALELVLRHPPSHSAWHLQAPTRPRSERKYVDLVTSMSAPDGTAVPVIFLIDVEPNHAAVGACLDRGLEFLTSQPSGRAVYIRDARCALPAPPRWRATNAKLQRFQALGGQVIRLDRDQAARWYALALLSYAVREGDITLVNAEQQLRALTADEFAAFVGETCNRRHDPAFAPLHAALGITPAEPATATPSEPAPESATTLAERACPLLRKAPAMMLSARTLAEALTQAGTPVEPSTLLPALRTFPERFRLIPSRDDVVISLNKSWARARDT